MIDKKITVIGAGSGGIAFSTYFASMGKNVTVYDNDCIRIDSLKRKKVIDVTGALNASIDSLVFTSSIEEAMIDSRFIMVSITTNNISNLAKKMSPYIKPEQIIVLNPGHTFGAIEFIYTLKENGVINLPTVAETQDLIFACRLDDKYNLKINGIKKVMDIATYNTEDIKEVISNLSPYFPQFNPVKNVWATSLNNISSILHPIPMLLNISRIENEENYKYYFDGISKTITEFMSIVDQERLSIGKALGVNLTSILTWMKNAYNVNGNTIYECIQNNNSYSQIIGPKTLKHRFIYEDISSGLVPLAAIGHKLGVGTKMMDIFIDLGNIVCQRDYREEGRNLEKVGLDQLEIDNIINLFE
ncbi:NAD/NADP-dependent octopine/nopaline dehydrogenase family protein [Tissierella sp. Yu-01]|uniref:NAD/NADP-dependent octopine/nopaline dehydrogenase family protein n=1 Tax=Tissierella sp. Yu-01 TaxID=3035694 RepID=UPI00240E5C33|nr:NAD/NADP-dependent octopine/nopaline dehydrogenase family protein [Tissierella sp. Yu-01]WFA08574.1 NAD/NADP octopine/nopaline dehydrogenase family protein [Tissierella sp. Yu-01]